MGRCRACGALGRFLFSKRGYEFAACDGCGCRYVADEVPALVYDESYFAGDSFGGYPDYLGDRELIVENFARRARWLRSFVSGTRLLDVGAAYGFFVHAAGRAGFDALGVEPAAGCVDWARRELQAPMMAGAVEDVCLDEASFDVVTLFDVIEHVKDPACVLSRVRRWLRPGGMVLVETGDFEALLPRLCGARWYYYDPPQHLTFFSRSSLDALFQACGFERAFAVGHLGRSVSLKNVSYQLGRSLGDGILGRGCRRLARSRLGRATFDVPDRGNVFTVVARAATPG